ncbi:uncharacterized protein (DUF302 family) [Silvimonas terrae]|uniref:Uncharacterized protein (DUF302 family) n=1 Tax=Silvimonas terrae TaxID=300266 RepID=A0A840RF20_9NEIS|nr:uncharacterized protein (DUF302 family) [Silvimonas terrae]
MSTARLEQTAHVEIRSPVSFAETVSQLETAIKAAGMTVFARLDHAAGAASVGLHMPPTLVLVYGNPKAGTPLMLASPLFALDLPLKVLVREDAGTTWVAFHPIQAQARLAGLTDEASAVLHKAQALIEATLRTPT